VTYAIFELEEGKCKGLKSQLKVLYEKRCFYTIFSAFNLLVKLSMKWLTFQQYISGLFFSAGDRMWEIQSKILKQKQKHRNILFLSTML